MKSEIIDGMDLVKKLRDWSKNNSTKLPIDEVFEALEAYDTLRTQLKSVEADAELRGYVAGLREAERLVRVHFAPNTLYVSEIRQAIQRACQTQATDNKSLLLRLQEAEWLLEHYSHAVIVSKSDEWQQRRDTFLNPKPQDVK